MEYDDGMNCAFTRVAITRVGGYSAGPMTSDITVQIRCTAAIIHSTKEQNVRRSAADLTVPDVFAR